MPRSSKVKVPDVAVVDFETKPIENGPSYPPEPVGVSIMLPGERGGKYYAWGHPSENNCTREDGIRALKQVWSGGLPILCHHAKFDVRVAVERCGLPMLPWERVHETMYLLFLVDPYSNRLDLKGAAEDLLGMQPEEQDAIREWAIAQKLMPKTRKNAGEFIHLAPGKMVGKYANGDTLRTKKLFLHCYPEVVERGMLKAYQREQRLLPVLMENEKEGIATDLALLRADAKKYGAYSDAEKFGEPSMFSGGAMDQADDWLRRMLKAKTLNVDSDEELANALIKAKKADPDGFMLTPTGKRSTAKDSIIGAVKDKKVLGVLQYRSKLATAKNTFLLPWLKESEEFALKTGQARVHPSWNQVRQQGAGARTGRLSASRFMNVPKPFMEKAGKYEHPAYAGLPELPVVRNYTLPDKGHVWGKRDYSQQELRVLGHFEDGELLEQYREDPYMDVHVTATKMMLNEGIDTNRDQMKTIGFGLIYGMGLGSLAERLGVDVATAKRLKAAYLGMFPGLKALIDDLTAIGKSGEAMRTWGGRQYYVEPPKYSSEYGRVQSFEYKLINYLVQGSSADCTKEAIIRYHEAKKHGRFRVTVHDEINISAPTKAMKNELLLLRDVMASIEFDVPMLSEASMGDAWGRLKKFEEPRYSANKSLYRSAA